jgi:archaeal flagellin FlaB
MFTKMKKALATMHRDEKGMTGLETAIILIAFVTVAAVFSYAVLSAGLFSAERGKETVYAGLAEAKANLEISGDVIVYADESYTSATKILFTVKNAIAGTPIDMTDCDGTASAINKCVISLTTAYDYLNNVKWTKESIGRSDEDNLLESGEQFEVTIDLADLGDGKTLTENLSCNDFFNLQVKPSLGSTITIQRTLPAGLDLINDMH